ncbi:MULTISPECIES: DUF255 domain-containing protein [Paenibacillus]|uniref:DUF255 domain-containing protein n=1 Tax=Paenibacillus TaxID=44249 RepID=UPI000B1E3E25|nr:DUF255 domain-containing protein [Paenibacillus odorifer]MEC0129911.1 DUF255 domain-containing protein [Paenibacillus odorifer]MEC0223846.1 DUF255 domain-containing protein [Paenibacillus odorifer]
MTTHRVPNRLAKEKSPYLLQYVKNLVNWFTLSVEDFKSSGAITFLLYYYA